MFAASKSGKAAAAVATDQYFPYVPLLLEPTTTNGQQNNTFLDSSTNNFTITRNGTPTQGSVTPYWPNGQWSNYFNGNLDYLTVPAQTALSFAGDFTIEVWAYFTSAPSTNWGLIDARATAGTLTSYAWNLYNSSGTKLDLVYGAARLTSATSVSANQWVHLAVTRSGSTIRQFINGVLDANTATTSAAINANRANIYIAALLDNTTAFPGFISNLRVVNGTAVYTSSFTPSTTPLTAITNTALLTCQSNRFKDNSTNNFTVTANGTPKVQAFQPFSPTASYTTASYGGSGYFNGSSDYLSAPANAAFAFGTGAFTVEAWVYVTTLQDILLFDTRSSASASGIGFYINSSGVLYYSGSANTALTSTSITGNSWNHVAWSYDGTTLSGYINGVRGGTATPSFNITQNNGVIGRVAFSASAYMAGYISNLRVVKGTAVYSGASFTPPTSPVTAITNTSLLTNFTNAGIYDAAVQNNMITTGTAQASTTQYKWSPTSMKFASGDTLSILFKPQLQLGTGDFTIDGWLYYTGSGNQTIITSGSGGFTIYIDSALNGLYFTNIAGGSTIGPSLTASTWIYFAIVRSGTATGNLKIYTNGTLGASSIGANTDNYNQTNNFTVGGGTFAGYLQDLRITKGIARTVTTVPTAAFPTR